MPTSFSCLDDLNHYFSPSPSYCPFFAAAGYCTQPLNVPLDKIGTKTVLKHCKKSCKACADDYTCQDNGEWTMEGKNNLVLNCLGVLDGQCQSNLYGIRYMKNCRATCNACGGCKDNVNYAAYCSAWANQGNCDHKYQADFMKEYCMASCNACSNTPTAVERYVILLSRVGHKFPKISLLQLQRQFFAFSKLPFLGK